MKTNKFLLKRRSLLSQLGAAAFLATPVFRSVLAEAQAAAPKRLILVGIFGGLPQNRSTEETDWSWTGAMSALREFESDMITFRGLRNNAARRMEAATGTDTHGAGTVTMFSGASVDARNHSLDHAVADQIGQATRLASLQVGVVTDGGGGMDGLFQPSIRNHRNSWRNGQPQTPDQDPPALFNRLFGSAVPAPAPEGSAPDAGVELAAQHRYERGKSLLDFLMGQVDSVKAIAGAGEQAKLDAHLTALRELERGLMMPGAGGGTIGVSPGAGCMPPSLSGEAGVLSSGLADIQKVGADLTALTYQALNCDLTRVVSFMWFSSGDQVHRYPWLATRNRESHHGYEHLSLQEAERYYDDMVILQRWNLGEIGKLASLLKQTTEGDGNMLDNSALLIGSDMSNGDHGYDMYFPYILLGKAGGAIRSGRQITAAPEPLDESTRSNNDLFVAVGQAVGANITRIGDEDLNSTPVSLG
jgi:hypothetical protein